MRILTNLTKAELNRLVNQPTAKAMIKKVKAESIYIPKGDAQRAAEFVASRNKEKRDTLNISDAGIEALRKSLDLINKG